jgi:hypothetical protein
MTDTSTAITVTKEDLTEKYITRTQVSGWLRYWHFLRPMKKSEFKSFRQDIYRDGVEPLTGLKRYGKKLHRNITLVEGIDDSIADTPKAVRCDSKGIFTVVYDDKEYEELKKSGIRSPKKMTINTYNWLLEVYEEFDELPAAIIVGEYITWTTDFLRPGDSEELQEYPDFPVGLIFDYSKGSTAVGPTKTDYKKSWLWDKTPVAPTKACCAYDATRSYLANIVGVGLDHHDRNWYVDQDRVVPSGLPLEYTLNVLSELVEPYGVEIDKVWIAPLVWTEELDVWGMKLGVDNDPMYQMKMQIDPSTPAPRILTTPVPDGIAVVVCEKFGTGSASFYTSGHASYLSPRAFRGNNYDIALTFRRKQ